MCITWFILILEILLEKQLQGNFAGNFDPNAWHYKGFSKSFMQLFCMKRVTLTWNEKVSFERFRIKHNYALTYLWIFTNRELLAVSSMSWMFHNLSKGNEMHHESSSDLALVMWLTPIRLDADAFHYWIYVYFCFRGTYWLCSLLIRVHCALQ